MQIGIENCPMLFSKDEWPGGKNLATSPEVWRALFEALPSANLGLNFDPSHLVWQHIDYVRCVREFGRRIVHVHAKDTRIDPDKLYEVGILGLGWHTPKLPGLGDVQLGTALLGADGRRLPRGGVHRGGGPGLRGVAGRPAAGAAAEQAVFGAVYGTVEGWVVLVPWDHAAHEPASFPLPGHAMLEELQPPGGA